MKTKKSALGALALLGATLIWGSSFVILKATLDSVPALWILAIRFIGAAFIMALIAGKSLKKLDKKHLIFGFQLGLTMAAAYIFQTFGLQFTTPGKNSFLTATYCVIVPFMTWAFFKKRPDGYNFAAAFICIAGMALVSLSGDLTLGLGDGLTMCCGFFYALQIIVLSRAMRDCSAVLLSMIEFAGAGIICLVAAPMVSPFPQSVPVSAWLSIAYLCLMCTGVCFLLQAYGQKYTPPEPTAIILTLESVFGTALSVIFYREPLTPRILTGFALIFISVIVSETKLGFLKRRRELNNS